MSRSISTAAVLLSAGIAYGHPQGEVVSYYIRTSDHAWAKLADLPQNGFVLTDLWMQEKGPGGQWLYLSEGDPQQGQAEDKLVVDYLFEPSRRWHFQSGVRFAGGSELWVRSDTTDLYNQFLVCGYIPCLDPCTAGIIPALGDVGLGTMVVLLVAAGAWVFSRRQRQAA